MRNLFQDCTFFLLRWLGANDAIQAPVLIKVSEHTYLPAGELVSGWLPLAFEAFLKLKEEITKQKVRFKSVCSVGCGPGIEVIGLVKFFRPERVFLTDLHGDVLDLARENVLRNCPELKNDQIVTIKTNLLVDMIAQGFKADLIYENLPNLPVPEGWKLDERVISASFFESKKKSPVYIEENLLSLHNEFLRQARRCLNKDGRVLCCIGGRIDMHEIQRMFSEGVGLHFVLWSEFQAVLTFAG